MSDQTGKEPGGENPPAGTEDKAKEAEQPNATDKKPEGEEAKNQGEQPKAENAEQPASGSQPAQAEEVKPKEEGQPAPEEGENFTQKNDQDNPKEDEEEGSGEEDEGDLNQKEEEEEDLDKKESNYNSKELKDFLVICNYVVHPLEEKDIIQRSLENFQTNIKNSLDQIDKNYDLDKIDLPSNPDEDLELAKNTNRMKEFEEIVKKWTQSINQAQSELQNTKRDETQVTTALMEIETRKRAVSNWSILAQQLKSENITRLIKILKESEDSQKGKNFESKISEFEKTFEDANDYLKFLQSLERSIKDLSLGDLATIEHS